MLVIVLFVDVIKCNRIKNISNICLIIFLIDYYCYSVSVGSNILIKVDDNILL